MRKTSPNTLLQMHLQSLINPTEWCHARQVRFPALTLDLISLRCLLARPQQSFPVWRLPLPPTHPVWTKPRCCTKHSSKQQQASQQQVLAYSQTGSSRTVQFQKQALRPARILLQSTRRPRLLPASQHSLAASLIPTADSPMAWQTQQSTRSRSSRPRLRWILLISFTVRTRLTSPHTLVCRLVCPGQLGGPSKLITNIKTNQLNMYLHKTSTTTHQAHTQWKCNCQLNYLESVFLHTQFAQLAVHTWKHIFFFPVYLNSGKLKKTSRKIKIIKYKNAINLSFCRIPDMTGDISGRG